jgi:hypothetical protein
MSSITIDDKLKGATKAIERMVASQHQTTGIKIEFEEQLGRLNDINSNQNECDECEGSGDNSCQVCGGDEYIHDEELNEDIDCPNEDCDNGYVQCEFCHGIGHFEGDGDHPEWGSEEYCNNWWSDKLKELGLLGRTSPLVFYKFYNDHSVDSELTITLDTKDPAKTAEYALKLVHAWNEFADAVVADTETERNIENAGMHIAILNTPEANYSPGHTIGKGYDNIRYANFKRSMTLLMPALFFLSSVDDKSRRMEFRKPKIVDSNFAPRGGYNESKYGAINWASGALEFRVFETCYQRPDAILDNICVIGKALKYWTRAYTKNNLSKIANNIRFGQDNSDKLDRLFVTTEHINLLNKGLNLLKPDYYTIGELKKQRGFTVTVYKTKNITKQFEQEAKEQYKEYEERFRWDLVIRRTEYISRKVGDYVNNMRSGMTARLTESEVIAMAEKDAEEDIKRRAENKVPLDDYVKDHISNKLRNSMGDFRLSV